MPDPDNRVTLAAEKDALGLPRPRLHYSTGEYATEGMAVARDVHERLFNALGVTQIHHWPGPQGAGHLIRTCRMGNDPTTSVVDKNLRLHGHTNTYVVSTAAWPTVGTANPTLTLAALALRSAAAIHKELS